jgi:hypothetical protein
LKLIKPIGGGKKKKSTSYQKLAQAEASASLKVASATANEQVIT